jgi:pimeloyl-ACP methyl ester carboxylesterase
MSGEQVLESLGLHVLTDIHAPVLIVRGAEDRLFPLNSVEDFARIRGARAKLLHVATSRSWRNLR